MLDKEGEELAMVRATKRVRFPDGSYSFRQQVFGEETKTIAVEVPSSFEEEVNLYALIQGVEMDLLVRVALERFMASGENVDDYLLEPY